MTAIVSCDSIPRAELIECGGVMRALWFGLAAASLWSASVTAATPVESKPGKPWKHKATGTAFPPALAGLPRTGVAYFTSPDVDVSANYQNADGSEIVTLYVYRDVSGSVPVWFDRSRFYILNLPDKFGTATSTGVRPFTPRGQKVASGLVDSFMVTKGPKTTGLMIFPFNGFYVKLRASSETRDIPALEALMMEAASAIDWSSKTLVAAAQPMADCPLSLAIRPAAKRAEGDDMSSILSALLGGAAAQVVAKKSKDEEPAPAPNYCREPGSASSTSTLYRANGDTDRYMLAMGDGGTAIYAGRNDLLALVEEANSKEDAKTPAKYTVTYSQLDRTGTYGDFEGLPLPEQALEEVQSGSPSSVATTWGKKRDISIGSR